MTETTLQNHRDFLFIYDAAMCNPNGDPDQENKPRMDYDTHTNLVTDTRLKRYIRDYIKSEGEDIFIDMEGDSKVDMKQKLTKSLERLFESQKKKDQLFANDSKHKKQLQDLLNESKDIEEAIQKMINKKTEHKELNIALLTQLVKRKYIDIRMFGSAFAVDGFNRAFTGAIQINWGYSLNEVDLVDSNSIVTIMNDDSSTFGKDYRVKYSLIAFTGSMNSHAAQTTGLTEEDIKTFRNAIWKAVPAQPTRSKINQYPKLYVEIEYNEGYGNGHFGDLRNCIQVDYVKDNYKQVRSYQDLQVDYTLLTSLLKENKGDATTEKDGRKMYIKPIKDYQIVKSPDVTFELAE